MSLINVVARLLSASVLPAAFGVITPNDTTPVSWAEAYAECTSDLKIPGGPVAGPNFADDFATGLSHYDEGATAFARATSWFFVNGLSGAATITGPIRSVSAGPTHTAAFCQLSWTDGTQSGDIVAFSSAFPADRRSASFPFVYGTPYTITSLLTGDTSASLFNSSLTRSKSLWSDTFTFLGRPDGTPGSATFAIFLDGSFEMRTNYYPLPQWVETSVTLNVSAALGVGDLPKGSWIETTSGVPVRGLPEGGSTLLLSALALVVLRAPSVVPVHRSRFLESCRIKKRRVCGV